MSVKITGPALSSLLFEHCNADGDRDGFLLGNVTNVTTNTISDTDLKVVKHQIVYSVYSFLPVYGISKWYDRKGAVDENGLAELLQNVDLKEVVGWYKLRRNSSMQVSIKEHAVHRSLSRWLRTDEDSPAILFMLCISQTARNSAVYTCDHQFMIASDNGNYECLPETVISLAGIAQPDYKSSAVSVTSEQCTYNQVLSETSHAIVDANGDPLMVREVSSLGEHLRQKLKTLCDRVLDTEEQIAKKLAERRRLRQQLMERHDQTGDVLSVAALSDALASSVEEKPLMKMSVDVPNLPVDSPSNSGFKLFDSDGSDAELFPDMPSGMNEQVMLLDTVGDEASSLQVPCLIPNSIPPAGSPLPTNVNDQTVSAAGVPADAVDASRPNVNIQEPSPSQMFDFVNDMIRSSSPNLSNQSSPLPNLRSRATRKGDQQM